MDAFTGGYEPSPLDMQGGVVFIMIVLFLFSFPLSLAFFIMPLQRILRFRRYMESSDRIQDLFTDHALYRRCGSL